MNKFKKLLDPVFRKSGFSESSRRNIIQAFEESGNELTGDKNTAVSGSPGSNGNLAEWDSNGDLIGSGHSIDQDLNTTDDVEFDGVEIGSNLHFKRTTNASVDTSPTNNILENIDAPILQFTNPTGANDFARIDETGFEDGAIIYIKFDLGSNNSIAVRHKAGGTLNQNIRLQNREDYTFENRDALELQYDANVTEWREIGRSTAKLVNGDFVGTTDTQTITNKTIDANDNTASNFNHGSEVDNPTTGVHGVTGDVVGTTDTQTLTNKTINGNNNSLSNIAQSTIYAETDSVSKFSVGQFKLVPSKRVVDLSIIENSTIDSIDTSAFSHGEIFILQVGSVTNSYILLGTGITMLDEDYYLQFNSNEYPLQSNDIHLFLVMGGVGNIKEIARYKNANSQLDNTRINTVSSNYQTQSEDLLKVSSSGTTITISTYDINQGNTIRVKDTSGNASSSAITINTQSSQNIDGGSSVTIGTDYGAVTLVSDGSNLFTF